MLAAFSNAWNRHAIDAPMSFTSEGCVFETSAEPDACGACHSGGAAVRQAFAAVWQAVADAHWQFHHLARP